jgi:hypothetical protein
MKRYFSDKKTQYWEDIIAGSPNIKINISSTINCKIPDTVTLNKIATAIKQHCPIKGIYWVYESTNPNDANLWWDKCVRVINNNYSKDIISNTLHELFLLNCNYQPDTQVCQRVTPPGTPKRMVLYLVY